MKGNVMTKLVLDSESLTCEYLAWGLSHKDGRNKEDLRFGQYIHNNYHLVPDVGFYTESSSEAYVEICEKLQEYQR